MRRKSYKTVNLTKINIAHREACKKHPKFCDKFTKMNIFHARHEEKMYKAKNETSPHFADDILLEEVSEARTAYIQGDRQHCLQELAQCGAVILRMMQFVENEMEARG